MLKESLYFVGIKDFYANCEYTKTIYTTLTRQEQQVYKFYVYSRPFLKDNFKDAIWEYLNEPIGSPYHLERIDLYGVSRQSKI